MKSFSRKGSLHYFLVFPFLVTFSLLCSCHTQAQNTSEADEKQSPPISRPKNSQTNDVLAFKQVIEEGYREDAGNNYSSGDANQMEACIVKIIGERNLQRVHYAEILQANQTKDQKEKNDRLAQWQKNLSDEDKRYFNPTFVLKFPAAILYCSSQVPSRAASVDIKGLNLAQTLTLPSDFLDSYLMLRPGVQDNPSLSVFVFICKLSAFQLDNGKKVQLLGWSSSDNEYILSVALKGSMRMKLVFVHILSQPQDGKVTLLKSVEKTDESGAVVRMNPLSLYAEIFGQ